MVPTRSRRLAIIIIIFCLCLVGIAVVYNKSFFETTVSKVLKNGSGQVLKLTEPDKSEHVVVLSESGFEPKTLIIRQNDQVVFRTTRGVPFWPASNLHPEHSIYPEFDPKGRVREDAQWVFKFERLGSFRYHDHLSANDQGIITVLPQNAEVIVFKANDDINECTQYTTTYLKQQCWDTQLDYVLKEKGIEAAFDYFSLLYKTEPEVPKECHGWGHTLGRAGYERYRNGVNVPLRPETAYCGFGYFHGFISDLLKYTGDATKTRDFCEKAVEELKGVKSIRDSCVHGFGHGAAAMLLEQPENWGNFQKTIDEGVGLCEKTYTDKKDLINCYDGVFNETHLDLFNSLYGLDFKEYMKQGDPLLYCKQQEERHKESCYFEFVGMFGQIFDFDVVKAMQFALDNVENLDQYGEKIFSKIAADRIQESIVNDTHAESMAACNLVPKSMYMFCFKGILNGFIQHGDPTALHIKAYAFCAEPSLSEEDVNVCYDEITRMLVQVYSKEQIQAACTYIEPTRKIKSCENIDDLIANSGYN